MATTPRMGWPYPNENQDPFWEAFVAFVEAQDASVFALREDRDLFLMKGGTVTFNATTGLVTWSAAMEMNSAVTGFKWSLPAGQVNLNDGDYIWVTLTHNPITNLNVSFSSGPLLPGADPDNPIVLGLRNGDRVYWRDGKVILDGQSLLLFSTMPGSGGGGGGVGSPGQLWRENIAMAVGNSNGSGTPKVMGQFSINPDDYALSTTTLAVAFTAVASVDTGGATGTVVLFDLTAVSAVHTLTFNSTTPGKQTASVTLPSAEHLYEVRGTLTAGSGNLIVGWAGLQLTNTIT